MTHRLTARGWSADGLLTVAIYNGSETPVHEGQVKPWDPASRASFLDACEEAQPELVAMLTRHGLDEAVGDVLAEQGCHGEGWPALEPFEDHAPPPFPIDALNEPLKEFVEVMAEAIQASPDSVAMLALAALSLPCSSIARVSPTPGHVEPAMLWVAVAEPPGARKSSVHAEVMRPIREIESARRETSKLRVLEAASRRRIIEKRVQLAEVGVAAAKEGASAQLDAAMSELAEHHDEHEPQLVIADATIEAIAEALDRQGGVIGLFSPEGQIFEIATGVYSKGGHANVGNLLSAHDAEPLVVNRKGARVMSVPSARLSAGLAVQPRVVEELRTNDALRGRGLVGRWAFVQPEGVVGNRSFVVGVTEEQIEAARSGYAALVNTLFDLTTDAPVDELPVVRLDAGALDVYRSFFEEVESEQRRGGRLAAIQDWASKAHGKVARIALVMHVAAWRQQATARPISTETMESAANVGRYLAQHALHVYAGPTGDPVAESARTLLGIIQEKSFTLVDPSSLHRDHVKRLYPSGSAAIVPDLAELERRGYLRRAPWADPRTGRASPSPRYQVRPSAQEAVSCLVSQAPPQEPDPARDTRHETGTRGGRRRVEGEVDESQASPTYESAPC